MFDCLGIVFLLIFSVYDGLEEDFWKTLVNVKGKEKGADEKKKKKKKRERMVI